MPVAMTSSPSSGRTESRPALIRQQLFLERESSGAVQLSQINTERLLAELVGEELKVRSKASNAATRYDGKYATICSSFGYQARCSLPSNFDCTYGSTLGATAGALVAGGHNGYMATARNLAGPVAAWEPAGVPFTAMMSVPAPGSPLALAASNTDETKVGTLPVPDVLLTTAGTPNFEAVSSYTLTVQVTDPGQLSGTATVTIAVPP